MVRVPALSSIVPVTAPSLKMKVSEAVAAPVRFSIRLKLRDWNPSTFSVPAPIPVSSQVVAKSISTTMVSSSPSKTPAKDVISV